MEIVPKDLADQEPVGKGREKPNINPFLPPPVGRMEFTLNPFKMVNQLVGPKFRKKCYCLCILILIIVYLVYALPTILGRLLTG